MEKFSQLLLLLILISIGCSNNNLPKQDKNYIADIKLDSIWIKFAKEMESGNIIYLLENSLDTIRCCECQIDSNSQTEFFLASFIFKHHLEKIMHLNSLTNRPYILCEVDSNTFRVNYSIRSQFASEEAYSLIFTFIKRQGKFTFQGNLVQ